MRKYKIYYLEVSHGFSYRFLTEGSGASQRAPIATERIVQNMKFSNFWKMNMRKYT